MPAAKAAPKRKVAVRPGVTSSRKPAPAPVEKPAPPAKAVKTAKPATVKALKSAVKSKTPKASPPLEISTEVIALRAYFLGEARQTEGLPGNSTTDWLEAERQLRAELC